jgi:hypothetical protein
VCLRRISGWWFSADCNAEADKIVDAFRSISLNKILKNGVFVAGLAITPINAWVGDAGYSYEQQRLALPTNQTQVLIFIAQNFMAEMAI